MIPTLETLLKLDNPKEKENGYQIRLTYHVTSLFIGGNRKQMETSIYQNFEIDKEVKIPVRALLFVPGKIITGVCFPEEEVQNAFPHMTLLLGKWLAKDSNMALEYTCADPSQPFHELYNFACSGSTEKKGTQALFVP